MSNLQLTLNLNLNTVSWCLQWSVEALVELHVLSCLVLSIDCWFISENDSTCLMWVYMNAHRSGEGCSWWAQPFCRQDQYQIPIMQNQVNAERHSQASRLKSPEGDLENKSVHLVFTDDRVMLGSCETSWQWSRIPDFPTPSSDTNFHTRCDTSLSIVGRIVNILLSSCMPSKKGMNYLDRSAKSCSVSDDTIFRQSFSKNSHYRRTPTEAQLFWCDIWWMTSQTWPAFLFYS